MPSTCANQNLSLRDNAARLVITTGRKKGQHPSPATVTRMPRDHDTRAAADAAAVDALVADPTQMIATQQAGYADSPASHAARTPSSRVV